MSTVSAFDRTDLDLSGTPHVPLTRLVAVELRKIVDTRAGRWMLIAIALTTAAVVVIFFFAAKPHDLTYSNFVSATGTPQGFLLPVLGILAITSEWSQRTGLVTFTLEPSRLRVVAAKFLAMIILGILAVVLAFLLAALGNVLATSLRDGAGTWDYSIGNYGEIFIVQLLGIFEGLAFGMVLMISAAAIVLYFVIPTAWSILFNAISALTGAAPWIDLGTAQQPLLDHTKELGGHQWLQLLVATLIWVVVPVVGGAVRLLRTELKSA